MGADNLSSHVLAVSLSPAAVVVGHLAAPELDNTDAIVDVAALGQLGVVGEGADGEDGLGDEVVAEEPHGQVDVVDAAVDEDGAVLGGVAHEEARVVAQVTRLAANHEGRANDAGLDLGLGFAV